MRRLLEAMGLIAALSTPIAAHAEAAFRIVHVFPDAVGESNPVFPTSSVTFGPDGILYGVTEIGGTCALGVVYGITTAGVITSQVSVANHAVPGGHCQGGRKPLGALTFDASGAIYGTASADMATATEKCCGGGAVFRIANGRLKNLYFFPPNGRRGTKPGGRLVIDANGNVYGTTDESSFPNGGVIFKVSPSGAQTVMHVARVSSFNSDLIADPSGNVYGTMGFVSADSNLGAVYKLAPDGTFTIVHQFDPSGRHHGEGSPIGGVIRDAAGNLYGVTVNGGAFDGGTIYKIGTAGTFTTLYSFNRSPAKYPTQAISMDSDGNIYGTAAVRAGQSSTPPCNCPVVFKLTPAGQFSVLYQFRGQLQLLPPFTTGYSGALAVGADGWLYGTIPIGNDPSRSGLLYAVQYKALPASPRAR